MAGVGLSTAYGILIAMAWLLGLIEAFRSVSSLLSPRIHRCSGPLVSVIIPVRLHSYTLPRLLDSIRKQECINYEVIIIDDRNPLKESIAIKSIAERYGFKYLRINELPVGWAPKAYALYTGYKASEGDVLVFIDADSILLSPHSLAVMRDSALRGGIAGFHPRFRCDTHLCKILATALLGIAHSYSGFHKVMGDKGIAWFYGCCWSITRNLYELLGGHSAVSCSVVEDRDFAIHAKRSEVGINIYRGVYTIATQWHDTITGTMGVVMRIALKHLIEEPLKLIAQSIAALIIYLSPIMLTLTGNMLGLLALLLQITSAAVAARPAGINPIYAIGYPVSSLIVPVALVKLILDKKIEWRGWTLTMGDVKCSL
ncbi:MAG: glycosyltransferase [Desulfurococcales archaeon]|nr:glycosyltransferase [Desulfurococcales archaeon]